MKKRMFSCVSWCYGDHYRCQACKFSQCGDTPVYAANYGMLPQVQKIHIETHGEEHTMQKVRRKDFT